MGITADRLMLLPYRLIRDRVVDHLNEDLVIIGTRTAVIPVGYASLGRASFLQDLLAYLDSVDGNSGGRLEVELLAPIDSISRSVPVGLRKSTRVHGLLTGRVELDYGREVLPVEIWQYVPVARLVQPVEKGSGFRFSQITLDEIEVSDLPESVFLPMEWEESLLEGMTYRSSLARGTLLRDNHLNRMTGVQVGDGIRIRFMKGNIELEIPGKAYDSGEIGDMVAVRPEGGSRRLTGRITGFKEVSVEVP
jgi:flagella basal body P-ring formation protein FlgA